MKKQSDFYNQTMSSSQNLVPVFGVLAGNTLLIGGNLLSCVGLLYTIRYVSTRFCEAFEAIPRLIENPRELAQNQLSSFDPLGLATRGAMLLLLVMTGVAAKRSGAYLSSDQGISTISGALGYGPTD
jgi:hypothetical protein